MSNKMPAEALRKVGRPPKVIDKLTRSINLKLSEMDYANVLNSAEELDLSPTVYARQMVLNGYVKSPFTKEELGLMRQVAGAINNLNQYMRHLNSGEQTYKILVFSIVQTLKNMLNDWKKS